MLKKLRDIFNNSLINSDQGDSADRDHALRLATAALLIEVVRADYEEDIKETEAVIRQLQTHFDLTEEETAQFDVLLERLPENVPPYLLNRQHDYFSGGDLHLYGMDLTLQVKDDINTMKKIRSYKGVRHEHHHKVRGQRSKSNGRTGLTLGVSRKKV